MIHVIHSLKGAAFRALTAVALITALCVTGCENPTGEIPPGKEDPPGGYTITITQPEHGAVSADKTRAEAGAVVTLTVTRDAGYDLTGGDLRVNNGAVAVRASGSNYAFTMPAANVTVTAWITLIREYETLEAMATGLTALPSNTVDTPYLVKLGDGVNFSNMGRDDVPDHEDFGGVESGYVNTDALALLLDALSERYVALDLSGISQTGGTVVKERAVYIFPGTDAGYAELDTYLVSVKLPTWVTAIEDYAFNGLTKLKFINWEDIAVTEIKSYAFAHTGLTSVTLPATLTTLNYGAFMSNPALVSVDMSAAVTLVTIYGSCFENDSALINITWPPNLETIVQKAFANTGLVTVTIPATVRDVGIGAFKDCAGLIWIKWPTAPANAKIDNGSIFSNCAMLQRVEFPENLTTGTTSQHDFAGCGSLITVIFRANLLMYKSSVGNFPPADTRIYVPANLVQDYKSDTVFSWGQIASQFYSLDDLPASEDPSNW
jgi:hypothetical protein